MRYLFLVNRAAGTDLPDSGTPEFAATAAAYGAAVQAMRQAGELIDCGPPQPASSSTTVRVRDGEVLLTDGPAAEIKEELGGYTVIECADLDEALRWAAAFRAALELEPAAPERAYLARILSELS